MPASARAEPCEQREQREPRNPCYVDTSVWLALLCQEPLAQAVQQWLGQTPHVCCSPWTQLELASAVGIKYRRGELALHAAQKVCEVFASMTVHQVSELAVDAVDFQQAASLCRDMDQGLRSGDALHLAVAMRHRCSHFFSFDKNLNRNAHNLGLSLITL